MTNDFDIAKVQFDEASGLVPAIVQDAGDGTVLMLGYMNAESLDRTLETRRVTFFSRSRGQLWEKGESSGHTLRLMSLALDCDGDALLVKAAPAGPTCHTGRRSCFDSEGQSPGPDLATALIDLGVVIANRAMDRPEGSYTTKLLASGVGRVAQKVAEEAVETALAAVSEPERLAEESADLLYHLWVLWAAAGLDSGVVAKELRDRRGVSSVSSG